MGWIIGLRWLLKTAHWISPQCKTKNCSIYCRTQQTHIIENSIAKHFGEVMTEKYPYYDADRGFTTQ